MHERHCFLLTVLSVGLLAVTGTCRGNGDAKEELLQLLRAAYPVEWSGVVVWDSEREPEKTPDARVIMHVRFPQAQHLVGFEYYDGTHDIEECRDGNLGVSFLGSTPTLHYPGYAGIVAASAAIAYACLEQADACTFEYGDNGLIVVHGLISDHTAQFDAATGYVRSLTKGRTEYVYEDYVAVGGCPWATKVTTTSGSAPGDVPIRIERFATIRQREFDEGHFNYAQYYPKSCVNAEGERIVVIGGKAFTVDEALALPWPDDFDEWVVMMREQSANMLGQSKRAVPSAETVGRAIMKPGLRTLFWLGLVMVLLGGWGMYRRRQRVRA